MVTDRDVYISEEIKKRDAEIERLRAALRPFADALKGNWSMQPGSMKIIAGPWASDLRLELTLAHFRNASYALEDAAPSAPSDGEAATAALAEYEAHGGVSLKDLKAEIARAALEEGMTSPDEREDCTGLEDSSTANPCGREDCEEGEGL